MVDNMHDVIIYKLVNHTDYSIERKQTCIMEYSYDTILSSGPACSNSITIVRATVQYCKIAEQYTLYNVLHCTMYFTVQFKD